MITPGQGTWQLETRLGAVMNGAAAEHIREGIPVLASYCDVLGIRGFADCKDLAYDLAETNFMAMAELVDKPSSTSSRRSIIRARHSPTGRRWTISRCLAAGGLFCRGRIIRARCRWPCRRQPFTWLRCAVWKWLCSGRKGLPCLPPS